MDPQFRLVKTSSGTNHEKHNVAVRSSTNVLHILEVQGSNPGTKIVFYATYSKVHTRQDRQCTYKVTLWRVRVMFIHPRVL